MKFLIPGILFGVALGWWLAPFNHFDQSTANTVAAGRRSILAGAQRGNSVASAFAAISDERLPAIEQLRLAATWRPPDTVSGLMEALRELQSVESRLRSTLQSRILLQLVRVNAKDGFRAIADSDLGSRRYILKEYVGLWAATDPKSADAAIRGFEGDSALRTDLAKQAAEVMADTESRLAVKLVVDFDLSFPGDSSLEKAFGKIAQESPLEAAELAFAVEDRHARGWAIRSVMREWGKRDAQAAIEHLQSREITHSNHSSQWWSALFAGWAEADREAALAGISQDVPRRRVSSVEGAVIKTWAKSDPEAALDYARGLEDQGRRKFTLGMLSAELADAHPELALDALLESGAHPSQGSSLFRTFATKDWEGTMDTLGKWEDADYRAQAATNMIEVAHESGRRLEAAEAEQLFVWIAESRYNPMESTSGRAVASAARAVASGFGHEEFFSWETEHPEVYQMLLGTVIHDLKDSDPRRALELSEDISDKTIHTQRMRQGVVSAWALQEPAEAAAWAESDPAAATNDGTFLKIASAWSSVDPASAETWISSLASAESRDQAARGFADTVMFGDSETALGVAEQIRDEEARHEVLTTIWSHRLERDVTAAKRDFENAELPAAVRAALEPKIAEAEAWHRLATSGE